MTSFHIYIEFLLRFSAFEKRWTLTAVSKSASILIRTVFFKIIFCFCLNSKSTRTISKFHSNQEHIKYDKDDNTLKYIQSLTVHVSIKYYQKHELHLMFFFIRFMPTETTCSVHREKKLSILEIYYRYGNLFPLPTHILWQSYIYWVLWQFCGSEISFMKFFGIWLIPVVKCMKMNENVYSKVICLKIYFQLTSRQHINCCSLFLYSKIYIRFKTLQNFQLKVASIK